MTLIISEILEKVNAAKTVDDKLRVISDNWSPALKIVLKYIYDPNIKFFTEKAPDYNPDLAPVGVNFSTLNNEAKKLYIFLSETKVSAAKKHAILIEMMESINEKDAELLASIINRTVKLDKLPVKLMKEKIPQLFV